MFLEEHTLKDAAKLPVGHPAFWLEDVIIKDVLKKSKPIHDKEHEDMLVKWGSKPEHTSKLTIRIADGVAFADRLYHCMLHLRYWKEEGKNLEHVERFEKQFNFNLDDLTLPAPSAEGSEHKY